MDTYAAAHIRASGLIKSNEKKRSTRDKQKHISLEERHYFSVTYTNFPIVPQLVAQASPKW